MNVIDGGRNNRKRPTAPDPMQSEAIPKPEGLPDDAAAVFDELQKIITGRVQTSAADTFALEDLARSIAKVRKLEKIVEDEGEVIVGHRGAKRRHPALAAMRQYEERVKRGLDAFGLSPRARRALGVETEPEWAWAQRELERIISEPRNDDGAA